MARPPVLPKGNIKQGAQGPNPQGLQFPPNTAGILLQQKPDQMTEMTGWLVNEYLLPQIMERRPYEPMWDELLRMYKVKMNADELTIPPSDADESLKDRMLQNQQNGSGKAQLSDSVIYDAVDRLTNLNHFISWKDGRPVQFQPPKDENNAKEDQFYSPESTKYASINGLLDWNIKNQEVNRKHLITSRHHYLYGMCFVGSDFVYRCEPVQRQMNTGQIQTQSEIMDIGVSFDPISIRRIWLNYRLPIYDMKFQPCPFMFKALPRFAILQHVYDPVMNPFGFQNLDKLDAGQWMFSAPEMEEARKALESRLNEDGRSCGSLSELIRPEHSVESLWTFHPMMPYDDTTGEWKMRADGVTPVPYKRFIWQIFANNLMAGKFNTIRLQANFYPNNDVPIFGSSHMPDLDSGLYAPAIGEILENHYKELCTAANQYIDNKNLINDPPSWVTIGSPSQNQERNRPGARLVTTGPNDCGWRNVPDGTMTTVNFIKFVREQAQTSSKAVDAILGKALGGRTSATEAQNVFQAAMSGVTTDIDLFNYDIMGAWADKVYAYTGLWFNADLIKAITGLYGPALLPEDLHERVDMKWDVGSTYIETIVKQQNLRYVLESGRGDPNINGAILWRELFKEFRMPECAEAIQDNGFEANVYEATEQATDTYMGNMVIIDPAQDQQVAIEVKMRFLKDVDSKWNKQYGALPSPEKGLSRVQYLAEQIQMHQQFALAQMKMQAAQMQLQVQAQAAHDNPPLENQKNKPKTAGQVNQQNQGQ